MIKNSADIISLATSVPFDFLILIDFGIFALLARGASARKVDFFEASGKCLEKWMSGNGRN